MIIANFENTQGNRFYAKFCVKKQSPDLCVFCNVDVIFIGNAIRDVPRGWARDRADAGQRGEQFMSGCVAD
ncbi:hypothetical protein [Burkholderia sp. F1]|uniref:hypothetical protein n=1 Tax=Burkholderia sp. F1 TaxID=3366817 RepID=UPI003D759CBF